MFVDKCSTRNILALSAKMQINLSLFNHVCVNEPAFYRSPALYIISFSPSRPLACVVSKTTSFTDRHIFRNTLHNCPNGSRLLRCFRPNKKSYGCRYKKIVSLVTYKSKHYILFTKGTYDLSKFPSPAIASCHWNFTQTRTRSQGQILDLNKLQRRMMC